MKATSCVEVEPNTTLQQPESRSHCGYHPKSSALPQTVKRLISLRFSTGLNGELDQLVTGVTGVVSDCKNWNKAEPAMTRKRTDFWRNKRSLHRQKIAGATGRCCADQGRRWDKQFYKRLLVRYLKRSWRHVLHNAVACHMAVSPLAVCRPILQL